MIKFTEEQKEAICDCLKYRINEFQKRVDELVDIDDIIMANATCNELYYYKNKIDLYNKIISTIKQG